MPKPANPVILDTAHPLLVNPVVCVPFTEGTGEPKDLARPGLVAYPTDLRNGANRATWATNADGPCGVATNVVSAWDLHSEGPVLPLPTDACTVALVRRKVDTTARGVTFAAAPPPLPSQRFSARMPSPTDGLVHWVYGANELTWAGYTPTTALEHWVFTAGPSGMAIYQDSATAKATSATSVARTAGTVANAVRVFLNGDAKIFGGALGDLQEISLFVILATQWSSANVATWLASPYAFLLAGTPAPRLTLMEAQLPDMSGLSPVPDDALGGGTRTCTALDDFQTFLSGAGVITRGETVLVEANHVYQGGGGSSFDGPNNLTGSGWSAFRSTQDPALNALGGLPPAGTRMDPAFAAFTYTLRQSLSSHNVWIVREPCEGLRISGAQLVPFVPMDPFQHLLVSLTLVQTTAGAGGGQRFMVDRCYFPGDPVAIQSNAIAIPSGDVRIVQNYITLCWGGDGGDPKAVGAGATKGTHLIEDNYLAGVCGGAFYGGQSNINDEAGIPKHIVVRRNTIEHLKRWQGYVGGPINAPEFVPPPSGDAAYGLKSVLEFKVGQYILIEGNTFINAFGWPFITLDSWNQNNPNGGQPDSEPYNRLEDITIRYNVGERRTTTRFAPGYGAYGFIQIYLGNKPLRRIHVHDNLAWTYYNRFGVVHLGYGEGAMAFFPPGGDWGITDIRMEHNTVFSDRGTWAVQGSSGKMRRFSFKYNISGYGHGGVSNDQDFGRHDDGIIAAGIPERDIAQNAFVDVGDTLGTPFVPYTQAQWSAAAGVADGQYLIVGTPAVAGISETTGGLATSGVLDSVVTGDGQKIGVDFVALNAALVGSNPPPPQNVNLGLSAGTLGLLGRGLDISSITLDTTKRATVRPTPVMRPPVTSRPTTQ